MAVTVLSSLCLNSFHSCKTLGDESYLSFPFYRGSQVQGAKVSDKGVKSNVKVHSLLYLLLDRYRREPSLLLYTRRTMAYAGVGKQKTKAGNKTVCDEVGEQEG